MKVALPLSEDDKSRLVQGYKIMGPGADESLSDIMHVCFHGDNSKQHLLKQFVKENSSQFEGHRQNSSTYFDSMILRLQDYENEKGHQKVKEHEDRELCWWVHWQKHLLDRLKLPAENEAKLFQMKFDFREDGDWDTNLHGWDTRRTT